MRSQQWLLAIAAVFGLWVGEGPVGAAVSNTVVRMEIDRGTNRLGTVDVELFDQDKPETVRNFLLYLRSGAYSNTFLHRCVPGFVVQGGGFAVTNPLSDLTFANSLEVTNYGRLTNEFAVGPRLTNQFGTIAMAKVGDDPNSATSQWFFNLGNNSANLDNQNGGFTVFGRVLETTNITGTNVLLHFNSLAPSAGVVSISGQSAFGELPVSYTNSNRTPQYRELYYVRMTVLGETNVPGITAPTLVITNPVGNARFTNQSVFVSGTAADDQAVARVVYRVGSGPLEIAAGTNEWTVGVRPRPGFNTVTVESIDWDGNRSASASATFFYVSRLALNLQTVGQGRVQGLTNGQPLQVGNAYAATARPASGYFFDGWSGSVTTNTPSVSFQVGTNATNFNLTARFTRDFFPLLAGSYQGLIRETNFTVSPGVENTGSLTLALNRRGGFSGRIRHRGGTYAFTGRFDRSGSAFLQGVVGGISRSVSLRLNTTNAAGLITGSVSGSSSSTVEVMLERIASAAPATNAPSAGNYPFSIAPPAVPPGPLVPGGNGFGRVQITSRGLLRLRGTLGDGTPIVATARRSRAGHWPIYLSTARGLGAVQGWIGGQSNQLSTLESRLTWIRPFDLAAATYPAGFAHQVMLTGMRLAPASGQRYLNWVTGLARIEGADLVLGVTNTVRLNPDNTITIATPNDSDILLDVDLATGLVEGRFRHPWVGTTNSLRGVLFKPGESIRGQFTDGRQTGSLTVNVAPFLATQVLASVTLEGFLGALNDGGLIRFGGDGALTLTNAVTLPYDTILDANGHNVRIDGASLTRLFVVPTNQTFAAVGVAFADGRHAGTNGASGTSPQPGGDACGAGVLNLGGTIGFTNCVFTNFVVQGGDAGVDTGTNGVLPAGGRAFGGAICNRGGTIFMQDCLLVDNLAVAGAGTSPAPANRLSDLAGAALGGAVFSDGPEIVLQGTTFLRGESRGGSPQLPADGTATRAGFVAGGAVAATAGTLRIASNSFQTNLAVAASVNTNSAGAGFAYGGALFVESNVTAFVQRSVFSGNSASGGSAAQTDAPGDAQGGAIFGGGVLQLIDCALDNNIARAGSSSPPGSARGGAIAAVGLLSITNSTLHHNVAEGGLWSGAGASGTPSGAALGGAICIVHSNLSILNSTFAFNQALSGPETDGILPDGLLPGERLGGAIAVISNSTTLASVTLAFNSAGSASLIGSTNVGSAGGGGIVNLASTVSLRASLLVSNAPGNFRGSLSDLNYNFSSDGSISLTPGTGVAHTNVNVLLGALTDNGGPTLTMALAVGSPARDKIPINLLPSLFDQRGVSRPQPVGGFGDAGAVEAELTNAAPVFISAPVSQSVRAGTNVTFQALAIATNPIAFFWLKDGLPVAGATTTVLNLNNVMATNAGDYALVATNLFGAATSAVATLIVDSRPFIVTQPTNLVVAPTVATTFFVGATPITGLSYFWFRDGVLVGPNAATLNINNASPADRGSYFVVLSNAFGVTTSAVVTLTFNAQALQITAQPSSLTVTQDQNASFTVTAAGFPTITYQWFFADAAISGQTNTTLVRTNVTVAEAGAYHVVVTNAYLSLTSAVAILTVETNVALAAASAREPAPMLSARVMDGRLLIECHGQPGVTYRLLQSQIVSSPNGWKPVASGTMPAVGPLIWTMPLPSDGQVFFRAATP